MMTIDQTLPAKERLLQAAAVLFYEYGIMATGVDSIIKTAGVAKQSMYNNFKSKDELVACYLQRRHDEWLALYAKRLANATTPKQRILAVFLAYQDHAECAYEHGFRGCGLLNAAAELPADASGRQVVKKHKETIEAMMADELLVMDVPTPKAMLLAKQLAFLLEGAITRSGLDGTSDCSILAIGMAEQILDGVN